MISAESRAGGEGDFVCAWCGRDLLDDGGCPPCEWVWVDPLTRAQQRVFAKLVDEGMEVGEAFCHPGVLALQPHAVSVGPGVVVRE